MFTRTCLIVAVLAISAAAVADQSSSVAHAQSDLTTTKMALRTAEKKMDRIGFLEMDPELLSPRLREIRALVEAEKHTLDDLRKKYSAASDEFEALRIQRQIHDLKRGTEVGMLKIQLKYARRDGNTAVVDQLETILNEFNNPVGLEAARDRPASGQDR